MSQRPGIRNRPREKFVIIRNAAMLDNKLSLKAKGLLGVMLTFPDDWVYYMEHLEQQSTDGRDATRSAMRELLKAGYVVRQPARGENGRLNGYEYMVADYRQADEIEADQPGGESTPEEAPKAAKRVAKPRQERASHRSTGNPSAGKPVSRENRQPEEPADGKPEATKTNLTKTKNTKTESSRSERPATQTSTNQAATTQEGKKQGLSKQISTALGASFLTTLYLENNRRRTSWGALTPEQQEQAFRDAQATMNEPHNTRTFRTVLKDALDQAAGLTSPATPTSSADPAAAAKRAALIKEATEQRFDEVYEAALAEGATIKEATERAEHESSLLLQQLNEAGRSEELERSASEAAD